MPRVWINKLTGPPGAGKSTLALMLVGAAQNQGQFVAWIDGERSLKVNATALETRYAESLGVAPIPLFIANPKTMGEAFETAEHVITKQGADLVVLDGVGQMVRERQHGINGEIVLLEALEALEVTKTVRVLWIQQSRRPIEQSRAHFAGATP